MCHGRAPAKGLVVIRDGTQLMNIGILICGHFSDDIKARYGTYRDLYADMLGPG